MHIRCDVTLLNFADQLGKIKIPQGTFSNTGQFLAAANVYKLLEFENEKRRKLIPDLVAEYQVFFRFATELSLASTAILGTHDFPSPKELWVDKQAKQEK